MKLLIAFLLFCNSSYGQPKEGLPLIGKSDYTFMFMTVYTATFWANNKSRIYSDELKLELKYKMKFDGEEIVKQTEKELVLGGMDKKKARDWSKQLYKIFPNVEKNDRITAYFSPKSGIEFYFNKSKRIGKVKDLKFAKAFLDIWLGERSSNIKLMRELRGQNG
jgi:hypothetical protein